jgi:hypothetical protein
MFPLKFVQKHYRLTHYKIMMPFYNKNNTITIAELDLLTRPACWYGSHVLLLGPNDKFHIKLKIIVNTWYIFQNCIKCLVVALARSKHSVQKWICTVCSTRYTYTQYTHTTISVQFMLVCPHVRSNWRL